MCVMLDNEIYNNNEIFFFLPYTISNLIKTNALMTEGKEKQIRWIEKRKELKNKNFCHKIISYLLFESFERLKYFKNAVYSS